MERASSGAAAREEASALEDAAALEEEAAPVAEDDAAPEDNAALGEKAAPAPEDDGAPAPYEVVDLRAPRRRAGLDDDDAERAERERAEANMGQYACSQQGECYAPTRDT